MTRARESRGFTLVELIVAIAVVGIVTMIATPTWTASAKEDRSVEVVRTELLRAAATAARLGTPIIALVDLESGRVLTISEGQALPPEWISVSAERPVGRVRFTPTGRASGGPIVLLQNGNSVAVAVDPWTSRITVEPL